VNQVAKNENLLGIVEDGFQFVTKFFEVISVSATHIYHSALELCPFSTIRSLYYHQRTPHLPKITIGTPESWDPTIAISGKDDYHGLCIWSPCGRFIAAQTGKVVEIRNQLTLELITILQPTEAISHLAGPLAYSPDGRSIACACDTAIIIWDIQTGGVAKEIKCSADNMVWSEDGRTLCTIGSGDREIFVVHIHDVPSGTTLSHGAFQSEDDPHLWTCDGSFWVMAILRDRSLDNNTIDIFKVESTLTKTHSFTFSPSMRSDTKITCFSPTTDHISVSYGIAFFMFHIRGPAHPVFTKIGKFLSHCFSLDGRLFVASRENYVYVWEYTSDKYIQRRVFECQGWSNSPLQLSPTVSSIVGHSGDTLQVLRINESPTTLWGHEKQRVGLSRSGAHAARKTGSTVTIIDLLAKTPLQIINPGVEINGLVLTGKVLLVASSRELVAWLLTEEGVVDSVIGGKRVGPSNSIWSISRSWPPWTFRVEGQVGIIKLDGDVLHVYHTETGEVLHPTRAPQHFSGRWHTLSESHRGQDYLCYHNLSQCDTPPEDRWQTSQATLREGWVKDPEGKHRLWVPVEWRTEWDPADWLHDITTQFGYIGDRPIIIKF
jgi:hypothetical protein